MICATASGPLAAESVIRFDTGVLTLRVEQANWPLDSLCDFALRRNPRRPFLIVSKVLGRHIPARPSAIRAAIRDLAARIPADLPAPILVVGLAETAVGLGLGVWEELLGLGRDACFLHSTRQQLDHPVLARFEEPHSHASAHLVYRPDTVDLASIRSLVLVDDEISTGTTLANAAQALIRHLPSCERFAAACLTDWTGGDGLGRAISLPGETASLLRGRLDWAPAACAAPADGSAEFEAVARALGTLESDGGFGRLGRCTPMIGVRDKAATLDLPPKSRLRVIGTGEFTYPPFLLAEALEQAGHDVVVQSTTRSPVFVGGAIGHALAFRDNYGSGIGNFLYNADPADSRTALICHETPAGSLDPALVASLGGRALFFGGE